MALASAAQEAVWMRQLSKDMKTDICEPTVIFEDNQSAICVAKNPQVLLNREYNCTYIHKGT